MAPRRSVAGREPADTVRGYVSVPGGVMLRADYLRLSDEQIDREQRLTDHRAAFDYQNGASPTTVPPIDLRRARTSNQRIMALNDRAGSESDWQQRSTHFSDRVFARSYLDGVPMHDALAGESLADADAYNASFRQDPDNHIGLEADRIADLVESRAHTLMADARRSGADLSFGTALRVARATLTTEEVARWRADMPGNVPEPVHDLGTVERARLSDPREAPSSGWSLLPHEADPWGTAVARRRVAESRSEAAPAPYCRLPGDGPHDVGVGLVQGTSRGTPRRLPV